jgi:predicted enzyme related to lactoylglutathione lyase
MTTKFNFQGTILYVHDMPKARAFYQDVLGLQIDAAQSALVFAFFRTGDNTFLALEDVAILPPGQAQPAGSFELAISVEDVDTVYQDWKARGVPMIEELHDSPFGRNFLAKDPEGHHLSVYTLARR